MSVTQYFLETAADQNQVSAAFEEVFFGPVPFKERNFSTSPRGHAKWEPKHIPNADRGAELVWQRMLSKLMDEHGRGPGVGCTVALTYLEPRPGTTTVASLELDNYHVGVFGGSGHSQVFAAFCALVPKFLQQDGFQANLVKADDSKGKVKKRF